MYNESQCIIYALYAEDNGNTLGRIHYSLREQIFPSFPSRTSTTPELSTMEKSKRSTPSAVYFLNRPEVTKGGDALAKEICAHLDHVVNNI